MYCLPVLRLDTLTVALFDHIIPIGRNLKSRSLWMMLSVSLLQQFLNTFVQVVLKTVLTLKMFFSHALHQVINRVSFMLQLAKLVSRTNSHIFYRQLSPVQIANVYISLWIIICDFFVESESNSRKFQFAYWFFNIFKNHDQSAS